MRIALIGPIYPYRGGIAHYTAELHQALREHNHEVLMISFKRQYPKWLYPGRSDKDPSEKAFAVKDAHYWIDSINPITWLTTLRRIQQYKPDLLVVQWWTTFWAPCFLALLYLYRRLSPHSTILNLCHNVLPHEGHWWDFALAKAVLSLPTHHIVHSLEDKRRLLSLVPNARVYVVEFPPYNNFASLRCERSRARGLLGLDQECFVLLFFGFVRPYKGLEYLIRALHHAVGQVKCLHLLIVGEFWEDRHKYIKLIEELGLTSRVTIIDRYVRNEEIGVYFGAADAVVLPYLETSQSAVVQIAFAMGVPVIASDVGGLRESIRNGVTGLLVKPGDSIALAHAILRYIRDGLEFNMRQHITERQEADRWGSILAKIEALSWNYSNHESDPSATDS